MFFPILLIVLLLCERCNQSVIKKIEIKNNNNHIKTPEDALELERQNYEIISKTHTNRQLLSINLYESLPFAAAFVLPIAVVIFVMVGMNLTLVFRLIKHKTFLVNNFDGLYYDSLVYLSYANKMME
ncbi:hypothetical protein SNEBB_001727 [Seison nebaliae]|nr:hypothetical protein SNEBB_001727 [Seison nebaliae]